MIQELREEALQYLNFFEIEDMMMSEIIEVLKAQRKKNENDFKNNAFLSYMNNRLMIHAIACSFSEKNKFPSIEEVYPSLFKIEQKVEQWQLDKARFIEYINHHNLKK